MKTKHKHQAGIALVIIGVIGFLYGIFSILAHSPSIANGKSVDCQITADAPLIGDLRIDKATCTSAGSCIVSPLKSLSITSATGDIGLYQSGTLYTSVSASEPRLSITPGAYSLIACIPSSATSVRIGVITSSGGIVNDQLVNIQ